MSVGKQTSNERRIHVTKEVTWINFMTNKYIFIKVSDTFFYLNSILRVYAQQPITAA